MPSRSSEEQILEIFDELRRAMLANDIEPIRARVADDYRGSDAGGRAHGRDLFLQAYGPEGVGLDTFDASEVETVAWTDTVIVTGAARIHGRYEEQEFEHQLRFLDVYARRLGEWQLVASQVCDIVPESTTRAL